MATDKKIIDQCYCGSCMGDNVHRVNTFQGKEVIPDDKYNDGNRGIVVKCHDCEEVTGFLIIVTGVLDADYEE